MKRVAVIQSNYVPWKGYFDIINLADEFVLYDDVQYTKNDWRNRNLLKAPEGLIWLTIPVRHKGRFGQLVEEVEIADERWATKHWRTIRTNYGRAAAFDEIAPRLEELYERVSDEPRLSPVNEVFIRGICDLLDIDTRIRRSAEFDLGEDRVERLVEICRAVGATEYVSGPSAREYLDEDRLARDGISVRWMDYSGYPEYDQLFGPPFVHEVSILDLLLNEGAEGARRHMLTTRESVP